MKAIVIDLNSIQFCTTEFINKISSHTIVKTFIEQNNIQPYTPSYTRATELLNADSIVETNLGLLRLYITQYLMQHPDIQHQGYTLMVRSLEPDANGIPLQIYCFTTTTHWESYEKIQSQIIEYLTAIIPMFDLYPFQNASGRDYIIQSLIAQGYKPGDDLGINL
jgi:miniconductance mechanosensitive channel